MAKADPHRVKLSQLRALVAIADTGSFSEAALQMDLSQSAVSHAIATLEDELGVILLSRSRWVSRLRRKPVWCYNPCKTFATRPIWLRACKVAKFALLPFAV